LARNHFGVVAREATCAAVLPSRQRVNEANRRLEEARRADGSDAAIASNAIAGGDRCVVLM
jgi:hypothetical protein